MTFLPITRATMYKFQLSLLWFAAWLSFVRSRRWLLLKLIDVGFNSKSGPITDHRYSWDVSCLCFSQLAMALCKRINDSSRNLEVSGVATVVQNTSINTWPVARSLCLFCKSGSRLVILTDVRSSRTNHRFSSAKFNLLGVIPGPNRLDLVSMSTPLILCPIPLYTIDCASISWSIRKAHSHMKY